MERTRMVNGRIDGRTDRRIKKGKRRSKTYYEWYF